MADERNRTASGIPFVDIWLYRTGTISTAVPARTLWYGPGASATWASATFFKDELYFAINGFWPGFPIKIHRFGGGLSNEVGWAGARTGASLTAFRDRLWIAWQGPDSRIHTSYSYHPMVAGTFTAPRVLPDVAGGRPMLTTYGNQLALAWTDRATRQIMLRFSTDGQTWTPRQPLPAYSRFASASPAIAAHSGALYVAFLDYAGIVNLGRWTSDRRFESNSLGEWSATAPGLSVSGAKLTLTWVDPVSRFVVTGEIRGSLWIQTKTAFTLVSDLTPLVFPVSGTRDVARSGVSSFRHIPRSGRAGDAFCWRRRSLSVEPWVRGRHDCVEVPVAE